MPTTPPLVPTHYCTEGNQSRMRANDPNGCRFSPVLERRLREIRPG